MNTTPDYAPNGGAPSAPAEAVARHDADRSARGTVLGSKSVPLSDPGAQAIGDARRPRAVEASPNGGTGTLVPDAIARRDADRNARRSEHGSSASDAARSARGLPSDSRH